MNFNISVNSESIFDSRGGAEARRFDSLRHLRTLREILNPPVRARGAA
jgi:hypothetical protein